MRSAAWFKCVMQHMHTTLAAGCRHVCLRASSQRRSKTTQVMPQLCSDVDGTLLNPQQQLTSATRAALQAAAAAGVPIVVATGGLWQAVAGALFAA